MPSIATFDLTSDCPLRCRHCYQQDRAPDLSDDAYLARLVELRDRHGIRSALWVGGEPMLRPLLLQRAIRLFERNAVVTSAVVPFSAPKDAGLLVSIDGLRPTHDRLRGSGAFERSLAHAGALARGSFALMVTVTARTLEAVEQLPALVEATGALGALVGCYVGPAGALRLDDGGRDDLVDRLESLRARAPGVLLSPPAAVAMLRPRNKAAWRQGCIYRRDALAFTARLQPRTPCTYGAAAACDACGCPVVALQLAVGGGDAASKQLLRVLFPRRAPGTRRHPGPPNLIPEPRAG